MLNMALFDMGGTLEDIWYNDDTVADVMEKLQDMLRVHGMEPGCDSKTFADTVFAGVKEYKRWSEGGMLEAKPETIWPDYYLKAFNFDRKKVGEIAEDMAGMWEVIHFHRELRPGVKEMLEALKVRGYRMGVISNTAALYSVFDVLDGYGIRDYMKDATLSSVTGYRKPHPEVFRISMRQMQAVPSECVYVGDTVSRNIIGAKRAGFGKSVQIYSFLSTQKDVGLEDSEKPDLVINNFVEFIEWLDRENPEMAQK